jgi:predicted nucleic acid-binding protein
MTDKSVFIDTNILVYAYDRTAGEKHNRSKKLISKLWNVSLLPFISIQVLNEFFVNLYRKNKDFALSSELVKDYCSWNIINNDMEVLLASLSIMKKYQLSFWDSSIIAAANLAGVEELWSEDLSDGQVYENVKVINPLR